MMFDVKTYENQVLIGCWSAMPLFSIWDGSKPTDTRGIGL